MTIRVRNVATLLGLAAVVPCAALAQRGTIVGRVVVKGSEVAVGYAVIGEKSSAREQFASADGRFTLRDMPAGRATIWSKRIGYAPFDTTVTVVANDTVRVNVELSLITAQLPAVLSLAQICAHPGSPVARLSAELEVLFDQLKQNAERNRLLSRSYPFELTMERKITKHEPLLEARFVAFDTVLLSSTRAWRYTPGKMLGTREYDPGVFGGKWLTITMPELADFADERFLENHCFDFGGLDQLDGDTLLRIEFVPAPVVHDPDVGGTLFLDPKTYQLRVVLMNVVNFNKTMRQTMGGQIIRVVFKEILPGVPVLDFVSSAVFPKDDPNAPLQEPATETQRMLSVKFLKGKP